MPLALLSYCYIFCCCCSQSCQASEATFPKYMWSLTLRGTTSWFLNPEGFWRPSDMNDLYHIFCLLLKDKNINDDINMTWPLWHGGFFLLMIQIMSQDTDILTVFDKFTSPAWLMSQVIYHFFGLAVPRSFFNQSIFRSFAKNGQIISSAPSLSFPQLRILFLRNIWCFGFIGSFVAVYVFVILEKRGGPGEIGTY